MVALTIPAKPEYIVLCRLALAGLAQVRRLEEDLLSDLKLALTEACSNSVRHAYAGGGEGSVAVRYELEDERLVIEVLDDGPGFDPKAPMRLDEELDTGGLGIAIIRALVDELDIGPGRDGHGSLIRFVKYLR